jgi:hypothetical protein
VKDPKFHTAIFGNDDHALTDMTPEELQEARRYIIHGEGTAPVRRPQAQPSFAAIGAGTRAANNTKQVSGS